MNRIIKQTGLLITAAVCILLSGFNTKETPNEHAERFLVVGIAYGKKKCGSASFSDAVGYKYVTECYGGDFDKVKKEIEADLYKWYNVAKGDVSIKASRKAFGCIISYYSEMVGWNCSVKRYAVGFGNTLLEASEDAEKVKNSDNAKASYKIEKTFNCNN